MQFIKIMQKLFIILFIGASSSLWGASTAVVNSTADAPAAAPNVNADSTLGAGIITLRSAIQFSQGTAAVPPTTITFDISTADSGFQSSTNSWLIQPLAVMGGGAAYFINHYPVIVDGYAGNTAFPASPNTNAFAAGSNAVLRIEIKGTGIGDGTTLPARAFRVTGVAGCTFKGLCINNYWGSPVTQATGNAIRTNANNLTVSGCFIGTDILGTTALDMWLGLYFQAPGTGCVIGGANPADSNVMAGSGSTHGCIQIDGAAPSSYTIQRNYIGTDKTGQIALGHTIIGLELNGPTVLVDTNLVSGCSGAAILGLSNPGTATTIINNLVGTDATGARVIGNNNIGIGLITASGFSVNQTVKNNVIAGCGGAGIQLSSFGFLPFTLDSNTIIGNKIGLDITGTKVLGNGRSGIVVVQATNTTIGGASPTNSNIISGNNEEGIFINSRSSTGTIDGNIIGSDISGTLITDSNGNAFGNKLDGVHLGAVQGLVTGFLVGDAQPALANEIVNNLGNGVSMVAASNNNIVAGNFIGVNQASKKLGNQLNGVNIDSASNNTIG